MKDTDLSYDRGRIDARDQSRREIAELRKMLDEAADRIEALEAALREIAAKDPTNKYGYAACVARVALAPEQDK